MSGNYRKWLDRINAKQDILTEDNLGQLMDSELSTKNTPSTGDTVLGKDSLTGKAVEIPTSSFGGSGGGSGLALGETSSTAYRGDRGKIAYDHSQATGNPHGTTKSDIGLDNVDNTSDLDKPISTATQNALNTKADLVGGKVPSSQLPSYVDDVLEYANLASFPATGESGKIYIAIDTNITYRWSGSAYVKIGGSSETVLLRHITPTAPITGTTTETILYTWFIPANTFNTEDWIRLQDLTILSNTRLLSNAQVRVRFNDSNTLNTSISKLLATGVFPSGGLSGVSRYVKMTRSFDVFGGNIGAAYTIAGFNTDFQSSNYNINPFNPTIDNWLFVTIQLGNVSDSVYMKNLIITK